jgi:hypothetical protein
MRRSRARHGRWDNLASLNILRVAVSARLLSWSRRRPNETLKLTKGLLNCDAFGVTLI